MIEKILLSLFSFFIFAITHLVVFRLVKIKLYRFRTLEILWGIFAVVYTILAFTVSGDLISEGLVEVNVFGQIISYAIGLLIYGLLFFSYLHPYYINERSISVRICIEAIKFPNGQFTLEEFFKKYNNANSMQNRLDDMVYGGFVERNGDAYRLTKKGFFIAKMISFSRKFLNVPPGY